MKQFMLMKNYILVELVAKETKTASGFHIPDTAQENLPYGEVIKSPEYYFHITPNGERVKIPLAVKKGDMIRFTRAPNRASVTVGDKQCITIAEHDVIYIEREVND